jgi:hypothetical protein
MADNQVERVNLLFELYPDIQKAYNLTQDLRSIFEKQQINYGTFTLSDGMV